MNKPLPIIVNYIKIGWISCFLFLTSITAGWAQTTGIQYAVKLLSDGLTYQVSLSSTNTFTGQDRITNTGQVTILAPAGSFTVTSLTSVNGIWGSNAPVRAPSQNPSKDYFIFGLTPDGASIPYVANGETILFTFRNVGPCAGPLEVWATGDPFYPAPPSQPINVGNDLTALGFARIGYSGNVWRGNYAVGSANCLLLPVVAILSPAPNSLTSLTPVVSGTVTANSSVTLTAPGGQSCVIADAGTGNWSCNSLTLTAGPVTLTAVATNNVGPSNTATVSFTAVGPPTISITSPALNAQTNQSPPISGTATPGASVTVTSPNGSSCVTTADGNGNWSCTGITVPTGPVTITAVAGTIGGKTPTTSNFTANPPPTISIQSPTPGTSVGNSITVSGIATAGASVTLLGPNSQSCTTTANAGTGSWSCSSFSLPAGPVTLTAVASNIGGTATSTASYTVLTTLASCGQALNFLSSFAIPFRVVDPASIQVTAQPAAGKVYVNSDGTVRYQPASAAATTATFTLQAAQVSSTSLITSSTISYSNNCGTLLGADLCSVMNPQNLTTASTTDFVQINQTALNGTVLIRAKLNGTAPKGDVAGFVIGGSGIISVSAFPTLVVRTYLGGVFKESYTTNTLASLQVLSGSRYEVSFPTSTSDFDEVEFRITAAVGILATSNVYYGFSRPVSQYKSVTFNVAVPAGLCTDVLSQTTCPQAFSVLSNDIAVGSGILDPTTVTIVSQPSNGSATANADGTINFRPTNPSSGTAAITYQVCTKENTAATANNTTVGITSSGFSSPVCVGCSINNVSAVGDADLTNNASIVTTVGVDGYGSIRAKLSRMAPAGDFAGFVVENTDLLTLVSSLTIVTYKGGILQEAKGTSALLNVINLSGNRIKARFQTTKEFDEVEVRVGSFITAAATTNVFYGFAEFGQTCSQYTATVSFPAGMAYQCQGAFMFGNCTTSTVSGTFIVGIPSSGTLTFPLTVNLLGTTTVSVSGSGITGTSTQTIVSGQTTFSVPVSYDGSGPRGVRSMTITSGEATGTCSTTVLIHVLPTVAINTPATGSQTNLTPTVSGTVTTGASVTILGPGNQSCSPVVDGNGNWTCSSFAFSAGPVTLTAVAVNEVGSATAVTTFTAVALPTIAITVPAPNSLTSLTPAVSGTVTAGASVTLLAPGGQFCIPTVSGTSWSCNSLTLTAGPVTLTAVAANVGGTASTTTTFTAVAPPTIAITVPAPNSLTSTTPTVSGTVTAGASVTLLAPGGQFCTPTVSGTNWNCNSLTLTAGPVTLTAVATNVGGTASTTTTFTAIAPPTIAINTPAQNAVTYLNPVISGTATANSSVTVVGPGNSPCVVAVSSAGSWSCTSMTFAPGPKSVTASVTTIGGSASAVTSFTVEAPPCTTPTALTLLTSSSAITIGQTVSVTALGGNPGVLTWSVNPVTGISPTSNGSGSPTGSITFATAGSYILSYTATNGSTPVNCAAPISVTASVSIQVTDPLAVVRPKVFLAGAYNPIDGLMRDDLRTKNLLPLLEPYSTPVLVGTGFTHKGGGGNESTTTTVFSTTGTNAIVDWVFVELRNPSSASTVVATRSALLQRDGDVVDVDGTSPVTFAVGAGSYYISIRHRNHLGVLALNTIALSSTAVTVDFTSSSTQTYGDLNAQQTINSSKALWAGDADGSRSLIYSGGGNDVSTVFSQVYFDTGNVSSLPTYIVQRYLTGDLNLDGEVRYQGAGNDLQVIFTSVLLYPGNTGYNQEYIILEQIP